VGIWLWFYTQSPLYRFEKWWLMRGEFKTLARQNWDLPVRGGSSIDIWQENTRRFRKWSKGWSKNIESDLRNLKKSMMEEYDTFDINFESEELSPVEHLRLKDIYAEMHNLWLKEEVKAKQRSRDRDIKEGDRNVTYFHLLLTRGEGKC
jgi:hypothetical protein